jgi:hypothetical protein
MLVNSWKRCSEGVSFYRSHLKTVSPLENDGNTSALSVQFISLKTTPLFEIILSGSLVIDGMECPQNANGGDGFQSGSITVQSKSGPSAWCLHMGLHCTNSACYEMFCRTLGFDRFLKQPMSIPA